MKKLIVLLFFLFSTVASNAQVLDVIDKVASVLFPAVSASVKDIINNTSLKEKKKQEANEEVDKAIKNAQKSLVGDINKEINNLATIRKLFTICRQMNTSIGGLDLVTDKNFISHIMTTDAIETKRIVAIQFSLFYSDIQGKQADLKSLDLNSLDPNLLASLVKEQENIQKAIMKINGINGFTGGAISFEENITITQANNKIKAIDLSVEYIEDIKDSIEQMALIIDTRIKSYEMAFSQMKQKFE